MGSPMFSFVSCFSCVWLCETLWTIASKAPLSMGFSRQENWSGLSCLPPGDLPNLGIEPVSLKSPALAGRFFTIRVTWEALCFPLEHHNLQLETMLEEKRQWQKFLRPPHLHFSNQRATLNTTRLLILDPLEAWGGFLPCTMVAKWDSAPGSLLT